MRVRVSFRVSVRDVMSHNSFRNYAINMSVFLLERYRCALDTRNVSRVVTTVSRQQSRGLYRTGEGGV